MKRAWMGVIVLVLVAGAGTFLPWRYERLFRSKLETAKERAGFTQRIAETKNVMVACLAYADNHAGRFPCDLAELEEVYGRESWRVTNRLSKLEIAVPAARKTVSPTTVVLRERIADSRGRRVFGYADGRVEVLDEDGRPVPPL